MLKSLPIGGCLRSGNHNSVNLQYSWDLARNWRCQQFWMNMNLNLTWVFFFLFGRYLNLEPKYTKEEILLTSSTSSKLQVPWLWGPRGWEYRVCREHGRLFIFPRSSEKESQEIVLPSPFLHQPLAFIPSPLLPVPVSLPAIKCRLDRNVARKN